MAFILNRPPQPAMPMRPMMPPQAGGLIRPPMPALPPQAAQQASLVRPRIGPPVRRQGRY